MRTHNGVQTTWLTLATNNVQLGCGTLILIAIIVMVFSGGDDAKKLRGQLDEVDRKIDRLEKKIDDLSHETE